MERRTLYFTYLFLILGLAFFTGFLYIEHVSEVEFRFEGNVSNGMRCNGSIEKNLKLPRARWQGKLPDGWNESFRIVVLGDSISYGHGVEKGKAWPNVLEELLENNKSSEYRIVNMAEGGYTMSQKVEVLEENIDVLRPDVIVLQYFMDDVWNSTRMRSNLEQMINKFCKTHEYVPSRKIKQFNKRIYKKEYSSMNVRMIEENLLKPMQELNEMNNANDIILLLVEPKSDSYGSRKKVKDLAQDLGWTIIDMKKEWREYKTSRVQLSEGDPHPSALGHRLIAENVYRTIID